MRSAVCISILLLLGCDSGKKLGVAGATCGASSDCAGEFQCVATICVDPKAVASLQDSKQALQDAKATLARNDVQNVEKVCEQYMMVKQACPKNMEDLKTAGVISRVQKDPWGEDFVIKCLDGGNAVEVISPGPDRALGGADDIRSTDR